MDLELRLFFVIFGLLVSYLTSGPMHLCLKSFQINQRPVGNYWQLRASFRCDDNRKLLLATARDQLQLHLHQNQSISSLKDEQRAALEAFLIRKYVSALLPAGFGKSPTTISYGRSIRLVEAGL